MVWFFSALLEGTFVSFSWHVLQPFIYRNIWNSKSATLPRTVPNVTLKRFCWAKRKTSVCQVLDRSKRFAHLCEYRQCRRPTNNPAMCAKCDTFSECVDKNCSSSKIKLFSTLWSVFPGHRCSDRPALSHQCDRRVAHHDRHLSHSEQYAAARSWWTRSLWIPHRRFWSPCASNHWNSNDRQSTATFAQQFDQRTGSQRSSSRVCHSRSAVSGKWYAHISHTAICLQIIVPLLIF